MRNSLPQGSSQAPFNNICSYNYSNKTQRLADLISIYFPQLPRCMRCCPHFKNEKTEAYRRGTLLKIVLQRMGGIYKGLLELGEAKNLSLWEMGSGSRTGGGGGMVELSLEG